MDEGREEGARGLSCAAHMALEPVFPLVPSLSFMKLESHGVIRKDRVAVCWEHLCPNRQRRVWTVFVQGLEQKTPPGVSEL